MHALDQKLAPQAKAFLPIALSKEHRKGQTRKQRPGRFRKAGKGRDKRDFRMARGVWGGRRF